jgi:lantibiotic modifying enzyme
VNYLEQAAQVETFIHGNQVDTQTGICWNRIPDSKPTHTFYHGSAGIIAFYLELFLATQDETHRNTALAAGDDLLAYVQKQAEAEKFITCGFFSGWPGYVFTLNELYKISGDKKYLTGAELALARLTAQASELGSGIGWVEPIPFSDITGIKGERELIDFSVGAAGAGLIYTYAHRNGFGADALERAIQTADRLLEVGEETPDGTSWLMMVDMAFLFTAPNFAHGSAGVGYFFADLYKDTQDQRYLDAAISAADYVMTKTFEQDQGFLVCHNEEEDPARTFYLGVCHGPAGTGRLMFLLSELTGDKKYFVWLEKNFLGLESTGAPEIRSRGLWQNHGQCCGDAGIGDYALYLFNETKNPHYLEFAQRVATHMVDVADPSKGLSWDQAEHRGQPDFLEKQTGYMQGAAGIGSFLVHLGTTLKEKPVKLVMPDTPFIL